MTHPPEQVELVARVLSQYIDRDVDASATALLDALRPMIEAHVREECAKVADRYHDEAVKWAKEQVWFTGDTRETDSSRIAAAIREGRG